MMLQRTVSGTRSRCVSRVAGTGVVLLAALSTACLYGDEDRIRRRLDEVAQTLSVEDRETPMIRRARATRLTTYLTPDVTIDVGAPFSPVVGRDAVLQAVAAAQVPPEGVRVEFHEVQVTVDTRTRRARATATGTVMAGAASGGEQLEARELDMVFSEIGGEWLVAEVLAVRGGRPASRE